MCVGTSEHFVNARGKEVGEVFVLPALQDTTACNSIACADTGAVLGTKGGKGESLPKSLVSCGSNPKEMSAEMESHHISADLLRSQVSDGRETKAVKRNIIIII